MDTAEELTTYIESVRAKVKWFDTKKGFGFVDPDTVSGDAFLHITVLEQTGLKTLLPGATVTCDLNNGPKGLQVALIADIDTSTAELPTPGVDGETAEAEIKFYRQDKGYGFAVVDGLPEDVFLGASTLQRSGVGELTAGQRIKLLYKMGEKGPLAIFVDTANQL